MNMCFQFSWETLRRGTEGSYGNSTGFPGCFSFIKGGHSQKARRVKGNIFFLLTDTTEGRSPRGNSAQLFNIAMESTYGSRGFVSKVFF